MRAGKQRGAEADADAAVATSVRCVPIHGIATSAATKVPDEAAGGRERVQAAAPRARPPSTWSSESRTRNGAAAPSAVTGIANSASAAKNDPTTDADRDGVDARSTAQRRAGRAASGVTASADRRDEQDRRQHPRLGPAVGQPTRRASSRAAGSASVRPMMFAQTTVEAPKYGREQTRGRRSRSQSVAPPTRNATAGPAARSGSRRLAPATGYSDARSSRRSRSARPAGR